MSPLTHLLASWIIAAKTTDNPRDCRLVTLAGILPDADGLGLVVDMANNQLRHTDTYFYYPEYHHWLMHGAFGGGIDGRSLAGLRPATMAGGAARVGGLSFALVMRSSLVRAGLRKSFVAPLYCWGRFRGTESWLWHGPMGAGPDGKTGSSDVVYILMSVLAGAGA